MVAVGDSAADGLGVAEMVVGAEDRLGPFLGSLAPLYLRDGSRIGFSVDLDAHAGTFMAGVLLK